MKARGCDISRTDALLRARQRDIRREVIVSFQEESLGLEINS